MQYLFHLVAPWAKRINFVMPARPDWDDIVPKFNAKFGAPNRTKNMLVCAFWTHIARLEEVAKRRQGRVGEA